MSVQVSYKKQILFCLIFCCIVILVIEPTVRIYDYNFPSCFFLKSEAFDHVNDNDLKREICHGFYNLEWTDSNHISYKPDQHFSVVNINSDGFRGPEISLKNNDEVFRIFFLGGSTAFGASALSDEKTIPGYIQQFFDNEKNYDGIEVINAGVPGGYSFIEAEMVKKKILDFEPDLLVIYDGYNDNHRNFNNYYLDTQTEKTAYDLMHLILQNDFYKTPQFFFHQYFHWTFETTEIISFDDAYGFEKANRWMMTWDEVCQNGNQHGYEVMVMLQPFLGTGERELTDEELAMFKKYEGKNILNNYEHFADALGKLSDSCTKIVDLRNSLDNESETMYYDIVHTGDKGNKVIAIEVFEEIKKLLKRD